MGEEIIRRKIELHKAYWNREPLKRPLVSFQIGDYFVSRRYNASRHLLTDGKKIMPEMIDVDAYMEDFERMYEEACSSGQDGFWVAEPLNGIPWLEGMLGCEIYGTQSSFISIPYVKSARDLQTVRFKEDNSWFKKYLEFVEKLNRASLGRFPVGQPILRGASDVVGALMGQTELVYGLVEEPGIMRDAFSKAVAIFRHVIESQFDATPDFYNGYSLGFYHIWCPRRCLWFQEDLSALLSPKMYDEHLLEPDTRYGESYDYTVAHLHPASFFILDSLMQVGNIKAIQVNKDIGGPATKEMLLQFRKILVKKNLIIFGDLDEEDIDCIMEGLPSSGIFLNISVPTAERARELSEYIHTK
ncbi:hypothetical protein CEB3_c03540 [Peptococcaceae bacterium CEB3]|nr:hypothetical protein CEB3_c03540 [Peptococcaceae bacterium CEB3]